MKKDVFLKVSKNKYFCIEGLSPTKMLILSQIEEFERNGSNCFMTDETLANNFNVSISTISRAIEYLVKKNYIISNVTSKNENGKRKNTRELSIKKKQACQNDKIENDVSCQNDVKIEENSIDLSCQNDIVKDNLLKDNIKDNINDDIKDNIRVPKIEEEEIFLTYRPKKKNQLLDMLLEE